MYAHNLAKNQSGIVTVLVALLLPVMLGMIALVLDSANLYIRHAELIFLARQSATSGLLELSEELSQKAEVNKVSTCTVTPPAVVPAICASNNMFDFLSPAEIAQIISDTNIQNKVALNSKQFAVTYDPEQKINNADIQTKLGESFSLGDSKVSLVVTIQETVGLFFHNLLSTDPTITITGISHLPLQ